MSGTTVRPDELSIAIMAELNKYAAEVSAQIKEDVKAVAAECLKEVKAASPVKTGEYKKGWRKKVAFESLDDIRIIVYNAEKPQLTHLLEFGHADVMHGGRVAGKTHIYPAQENAAKKLVDKAKAAVKR